TRRTYPARQSDPRQVGAVAARGLDLLGNHGTTGPNSDITARIGEHFRERRTPRPRAENGNTSDVGGVHTSHHPATASFTVAGVTQPFGWLFLANPGQQCRHLTHQQVRHLTEQRTTRLVLGDTGPVCREVDRLTHGMHHLLPRERTELL